LLVLQHLRKHLEAAPKDQPVPDTLNETFLSVDRELSSLAEIEKTHSGCTAVVAFLRVEEGSDAHPLAASGSDEHLGAGVGDNAPAEVDVEADDEGKKEGKLSRVKGVLGKITGSSSSSSSGAAGGEPSGLQKTSSGLMGALRSSSVASNGTGAAGKPVTRPSQAKRVLYTANAGDARAVIWCDPFPGLASLRASHCC
jgi:protein phosphatase PTC1